MRFTLIPTLFFFLLPLGGLYSAPVDSVATPATNHRLRNDDPLYNKKYPWYIPAIEVFSLNGLSMIYNHYVSRQSWANVGFNSWAYNIRTGWEWDHDEFSANFFSHPYGGTVHFNLARSNGYNFYESMLAPVEGSLMYEYFGETTLPSKNDFMNSVMSGIFGGEILYRLSSNVLDDRTHGAERVFREMSAGIINPGRFINRFFQGRLWQHTDSEIYQKEPLGIRLDAGAHITHDQALIGPGSITEMFDIGFDYGDPFEVRERKPFDYFKVRGGLNFGRGSRFVDDISGHGLWIGKNIIPGTDADDFLMLVGGFQYSDYWDNNTFELGAIGLGAGVITKLPLTVHGDLTTGFHLAAVPLAGTSISGTKVEHVGKDYEYGGGAEARLEGTFTFDWLRAEFNAYFFAIRNYTGLPETELVGIVKPNISAQVAGPVRLGFEYRVYYNDHFPKDFDTYHSKTTEERVFIELYFPGLNK